MENKIEEKNDKKVDRKKYKKRGTKKKKSDLRWLLSISILTFVLSLFFSYVSTESIKNIPIIPAFLILLAAVLLGVLSDAVAIAITIANESHFHAKASKKQKGAKTALFLIKNSHKVSNFIADVIGDIASVLSGAISALIAIKISASYKLDFDMQFLISAIVASMTVGGKALGKVIAMSNSNEIVHWISKILNIHKKEEEN